MLRPARSRLGIRPRREVGEVLVPPEAPPLLMMIIIIVNGMQHIVPNIRLRRHFGTRGDYQSRGHKDGQPALHIYSGDMLAAPAAFAR